MKIVTKIILANIIYILLIALIYFFVNQYLDLLLAKLHFLEVAEQVNASLLEMRLAEKNFFLYQDPAALDHIKSELKKTEHLLESDRKDIVSAIGPRVFSKIEANLKRYNSIILRVQPTDTKNKSLQKEIRTTGRNLRDFSRNLTQLESRRIHKVVAASKNRILYFFCFILLTNLVVTLMVFPHILTSLKKISRMAGKISHGDFSITVDPKIAKDEIGAAIRAIQSMAHELQRREEQIIQSKKLASIGVLVSGVAHELGNPLNNIDMLAQTYIELKDDLTVEDSIDYMNKILEQSNRIRGIIRELLEFSKPKAPHFEQVDVNDLVKRCHQLVYNMMHVSGIDSQLELAEDLPAVYIDPHKMQSVFVNLFTNAIQAMSPGGVLTVKTQIASSPGYVAIVVQDTGKGIPHDLLPHIFDPFFSTKGVGGTGLGLFVSHGIVTRNRGQITIDSEVGVGTTCVVKLPIYQGAENEATQDHGH